MNQINQIRIHEKSKNKKRNNIGFKSLMYIIASFTIFVIVSIFIFVFSKGGIGLSTGEFNSAGLNFIDFLFGNYYDGSNYFAAGFMIVNTIWTSLLALLIAIPISIFTALFVTRFVSKKLKPLILSIIAILAAIPTVIYGSFGMQIIDTIVMSITGSSPGTMLTVIITLALMIVPTITILTVSTIENVDKKMEHSSIALGATKTQTTLLITLKSSLKGIIVASILGLGRAIGEATAVSMIASQVNSGPTFWILDYTRLITATMLQGFNEMVPGSIQEASMFAMASLLLITIIVVFSSVRVIEKRIDIEERNIKSNKEFLNKKHVYKRYEDSLELMNRTDQKNYVKYEYEKLAIEAEIESNLKYSVSSDILNDYSIKINKDLKYKKRKSSIGQVITFLFSSVGIVLLIGIISFLLFGGTQNLSWDYISTNGVVTYLDGNIPIYGLAPAIFGTILSIILTLIIAIPIGLIIGIMFSLYIRKGSLFGKIFSIGIEILAGIPALIYGIVGATILIPIFSKIGFASISSGIVLALFALPTIVKTTENALNNINPLQKNGSLALGATKTTTTRKVLIMQILPSITSSTVIISGLVMADSAIFITLFGTLSSSNGLEWVINGGTTLSTEIYKLSKLEVIPWEYIKSIGLVIMFFIFYLSLLGNYINKKQNFEAITFGSNLLLIIVSIFTGVFVLFIISLILTVLIPINKFILKFYKKGKNILKFN